ncbi:MAG: hypothetical protein KKB31_03855 [Nanoarchaeota archaeon]|nr:hypothetical protein [Nanoarchaeota archaeon]
MGVIRGGLLVIVSSLLFLSLLAGGLFLVLSTSLNYEGVQNGLGSFIRHEVGKGGFEFSLSQQNCLDRSEFVINAEGFSLTIPCSEVEKGEGAVINYAIEQLVADVYYEGYSCGFWECLNDGKGIFVLISEKAKTYWMDKFYYSLIAFIILSVLIFFLIENKMNYPILLGSFILFSGFIVSKISLVLSLLGDSYKAFLDIFISKAGSVSGLMMLIGAVLLIFGVLLRLFLSDYVKKKFSKSEVKDIVRKEVAKKTSSKNVSKEETQKKSFPKKSGESGKFTRFFMFKKKIQDKDSKKDKDHKPEFKEVPKESKLVKIKKK